MDFDGIPSKPLNDGKLRVFDLDERRQFVNESSSKVVYYGKFEKHKLVAVKRLQTLGNHNMDDGELEESKFLLKLAGHPNILKYYCTYKDPDFFFIVTELCTGTLEDLVNGTYNGSARRDGCEKEILLQISLAVAYLHENGIVHRDIKPENVFITEEYGRNVRPRMKLADFGISCRVTDGDNQSGFDNNTSSPKGTMGWMAPELVTSEVCNTQVDTFSLGLVFGYTLSIGGRHPFDKVTRDGDGRVVSVNKRDETRQYHINHGDFMSLTNDDLKENYRTGPAAFRLIESMLDEFPKNRPILSEVLSNEFFLNAVV